MYYHLAGKVPTPCTQEEWELMFQSPDRILCKTRLWPATEVSTVFIGTVGCLFETMVFDQKDREICERYTTYDEALLGHVKILKGLLND
jgi:hypothetical protein